MHGHVELAARVRVAEAPLPELGRELHAETTLERIGHAYGVAKPRRATAELALRRDVADAVQAVDAPEHIEVRRQRLFELGIGAVLLEEVAACVPDDVLERV